LEFLISSSGCPKPMKFNLLAQTGPLVTSAAATAITTD